MDNEEVPNPPSYDEIQGSYHQEEWKKCQKRMAQKWNLSNEFQKIIAETLNGLAGVKSYFDDIVVYGKDLQECREHLIKSLDRLRTANLYINLNKFKFFKTEIKFLAQILTPEGIKKDKEKTRAILGAPRPNNSEEVQHLLGMVVLVAYYTKYIPDAAMLTAPLRELMKKGVRFYWSQECEKTFCKIKEELSSDRVLVPYQPELPVILACDASPYGISGVLLHRINGEEKPIMFTSRSLTVAKKGYSQLNCKALAIYYSVKKFFVYLYGRKFELQTDNAPLNRIFKEDAQLPTITSARLLRYAMVSERI